MEGSRHSASRSRCRSAPRRWAACESARRGTRRLPRIRPVKSRSAGHSPRRSRARAEVHRPQMLRPASRSSTCGAVPARAARMACSAARASARPSSSWSDPTTSRSSTAVCRYSRRRLSARARATISGTHSRKAASTTSRITPSRAPRWLRTVDRAAGPRPARRPGGATVAE